MGVNKDIENIENGDITDNSESTEGTSVEKMGVKNVLNVIFYISNILITFGVGQFGWFGAYSNSELSDKYQTIVTPAGTAFSIWSIIFLFQAIFAVLQLLPRYRSRAMVQDGVGYWYVAVCIMQNCWTFSFGFDVVPLSIVFMVLIWLSLMGLLYSQYYARSENTYEEFWLLRFPFAIHGGWITCAMAVNANVVAVKYSATAATQLAIAIISLAVLHAISVWVLFGIKKPNYTIACVITWANYFIASELQQPKEKVVSFFNDLVISGVGYAAMSVTLIVLSQILIRSAYGCMHTYMLERESNDTPKPQVK